MSYFEDQFGWKKTSTTKYNLGGGFTWSLNHPNEINSRNMGISLGTNFKDQFTVSFKIRF